MKECRGELLGRVRKGLASAQERAAFELHLGSCDSCRQSLEIMADFDAIGEAESGDWERVARMATRAAAVHGVRSRPAIARRRTWPLAVAALVLTGAAIAGGVYQLALPENDAGSSSSTKTPPPKQPSKDETPSRPVVEPPIEAPANDVDVDAPSSEAREIVSPAPKIVTAAELYRAANEARRAGNPAEAIRGYQALQTRFPGSGETHASRVSLGGLLLRQGSASAALAQFDGYLKSGGGRLAAEALFGRAQALRALGRAADEAQNLQRLIQQYPNSAYATHAQRRLQQLR